MLSICVNVKNGDRFLARSLASLSKFSDVVLLDNYSTDSTLEVARQFSNVRIFQCKFEGMGKVRNLVASYARNDWLLFVDCDEVLEPELVDVLLSYNFQRGNIYSIYRKNYYDGVLLETSSWGNDWIKRLYNRNDTRFAENQVHDNFIDKLPNVDIKGGSMIHYPYEQVSQLIDKMQFYSALYAKQHHNKKHPTLWLIPFRAFFMFLKCYVLKRGFMSGYEGLVISSYNAIGVFTKYLKLYELDYRKKIAIAVRFESLAELQKVATYVNEQYLLPEIVFIYSVPETIQHEDLQLALGSFICGAKIIQNEAVADALKEEINQNRHIDYIHICNETILLANSKYVSLIRKRLQNKNFNDIVHIG